MKKILIITPGFAENETDTSCLPYLQDYISALSEKIGPENIKIITTQYPFKREKYTWKGIEVFSSGGKNRKGIFYFLTLRRSIKKIREIIKDDPYVIHAFWMGEAAFLGSNALKRSDAKLILSLMGQDVKPGNKTFNFLNPDKTIFICLSNFQESVFLNAYNKQADKIIPMPIPVIDPELLNGERDIDALFVGSLIDVKQPQQFIEIIKEMKKDFPKIRTVMAGDGYLKDKLQKWIIDNNLSSNIVLKGNINREDVFDLMRRSKLLIHTSAFEGQCLVYTEALAHGMYVLSYNTGRVEPTQKHNVCNSEEEIQISAYKLLNSDLKFNQELFTSKEDSINAYLKLYDQN